MRQNLRARSSRMGFVLSEVMIAVGLSAFLVVTGMTLLAMGVQSQTSWRAQSEISGQLLLLHDYFSHIVPNVGGNSVGLWSSIWIENDCAARTPFPDCEGSDRLWMMNSISEFSCRVVAVNTSLNKYTFDSTTGCCLAAVDVNQSHVSMTNSGSYAQLYVAHRDITTCTAIMVPGPMAPHDLNVSGLIPPNWIGSLVHPVEISAYYLDRSTSELFQVKYLNGGTSASDRETLAVADQVFDFQLALGIDSSPADGILTDNDDNTDEWLYNDPTSTETFGAGVFPVTSHTGLSAVAVGLLIGDRGKGLPSSHRLLDGPARQPINNWIMRSTVSIYNLRNSSTFQ